LSLTKLATGAAVQAEELVREAVDLEPRNHDYRLQWARCLKYLARYDQAVEQTRLVLEATDISPIVRVQALEQMALLAELGSVEVQKQAVALHNKTIDQADPLTTSADRGVRQAATQVLMNAHLAVAERIAAGDSPDKDEFVAQWISRASALAEQMIADGEADVSLRLQIAVSALASGGRLNPPIDPQPWVTEAEHAAKSLKSDAGDKLADAEVQWQLGLAYCYATEMSHKRAEADDALRYGALADAALTAAAPSREELPDTNFVLGRLYFQVGAVHAVHREDHATACQWYDRAIEPLSSPVPVTALAAPGLHSDALISMAVSYWENGDRDRAYELTGAGVELVEQGIAEGLLPADALEVPRNNFLAMSRALGKTPLASPAPAEGNGVQTAQDVEPPVKRATRAATGRSQPRTASRRNSSTNNVRRR
jgi:tetratricopeptide (TPR) repeat protein